MDSPIYNLSAPCLLPAGAPADAIEIGPHSYCSGPITVRIFLAGERVIIGDYCSIGQDVTISTGGNHALDLPSTYDFEASLGWGGRLTRENGLRTPESCDRSYRTTPNTTLGNDVWVGDGATIAGGARVCHGAVIGARAVVFGDVPPYAIVVGNPARIVRYRFSPQQISSLLAIAWWNWPEEKVREALPSFHQSVERFIEIHGASPSST